MICVMESMIAEMDPMKKIHYAKITLVIKSTSSSVTTTSVSLDTMFAMEWIIVGTDRMRIT